MNMWLMTPKELTEWIKQNRSDLRVDRKQLHHIEAAEWQTVPDTGGSNHEGATTTVTKWLVIER